MRKKKSFLFHIIIPLALILLLYIFHVSNNIIVINADKTPVVADSMVYYPQSVAIYKTLFETKQGLKRVVYDKYYNHHKPPLYAFSVLPWYLLFGFSHDIMCVSNLSFLLILIVSVFFIGKYLDSDSSGLLAAFIVTTYPVVFGMSRWCMPYFMSLSLVSLAVLFVIRSKNFSNLWLSLLAGITSGLAALTHLSSLLAVFAPYLFFLIDGLITAKNKRLRIKLSVNFLCSVFLIALLVFIWMKTGRAQPVSYMQSNDNLPRINLIVTGLKVFLRQLFHIQLHKFYLLSLIISAIILIYKKKKIVLFLFLWYLTHTLMASNFDKSLTPRFNMASLPPLALITSLGVFSIDQKRIRRSLVAVIILFGIFQYLVISYYPDADKYYPYMTQLNKSSKFITDDQINHHGLLQASEADWRGDDIIETIAEKERLDAKNPVKVWIIYAKASIYGDLSTEMIQNRVPIEVINVANDDMAQGLTPYTNDYIENELLEVDYILTYDSRCYDTGEHWEGFLEETNAVFNNNITEFEKIAGFNMPDGNILHMYKKIEQ